MSAALIVDDVYEPVFRPASEEWETEIAVAVDADAETVQRWTKAMEDFEAAQCEMRDAVEAATKKTQKKA